MSIATIQETLTKLGNAETAAFLQKFFKTGPGEYGEGDLFRGIRVPTLRQLVKTVQAVPLSDVVELLHSAFHEDRLLALLLLVRLYAKGNAAQRSQIYELYLNNTRFINNWDLVDSSAEQIVGAHLWDKDRALLYNLAASSSLWERRIAIMATFHFIKRGDFTPTLDLAALLLTDREDLMHKAVGWMLREVGKRKLEAEIGFLQAHYRQMPRTMLRYAIEKFPEAERQKYLKGAV